MGWITTRWEATHEGHAITVTRREIGRGFAVAWDGREIARRRWSWFGLGELRGTAEADGTRHEVHVTLSVGKRPGEGFLTDGRCQVTVDGTDIPITHVR